MTYSVLLGSASGEDHYQSHLPFEYDIENLEDAKRNAERLALLAGSVFEPAGFNWRLVNDGSRPGTQEVWYLDWNRTWTRVSVRGEVRK
jgi:hypothetical protein